MAIKKQAKKEAKTLPLANLPTMENLTDKELSEVNGGGGGLWGGEDYAYPTNYSQPNSTSTDMSRLWGGEDYAYPTNYSQPNSTSTDMSRLWGG